MDREYKFIVAIVIGTDDLLSSREIQALKNEAIATINVHMDIPGTIKTPVMGASFAKEGRL